MEDINLDYVKILEECGLNNVTKMQFIKNLKRLEEFYSSTEMVSIYNYCLLNINDVEILNNIIINTDNYRDLSTLKILLDILLLKFINLTDEEDLVSLRIMCAKAIANYKDSSTVNSILNCLKNKNEHYRIRLACADALGRIGDRFAVQPLISLVEDEEEKSMYLKESATFALGLIGDTSAIDPLISILNSKHGFLGKFSFLKEKIVEALGKFNINNNKILVALNNSLMDSSPMVRINAIEAIMNTENENAVSMIKPSLNDEDDEVKKNALIALYNLVGRDILDEVIELPIYCDFLKNEAQNLIDEYEVEDDE